MSCEFNFTKVVDKNGRIVIPSPLRKRYGFHIGAEVEFIALPKGLIIQPLAKEKEINPRLLGREINKAL